MAIKIEEYRVSSGNGYVKLRIPKGARILTVGYNRIADYPVLYAEVPKKIQEQEIRVFYTVPTGGVLDWPGLFKPSELTYLGTTLQPEKRSVKSKEVALHVYEVRTDNELPGEISG